MKHFRTILFIIAGLFMPFLGAAQQTTAEAEPLLPRPVYVSPEGKVFVKSGTPIYLRLAVSPDKDTDSFVLRSKASQDAAKAPDPFYFEGHGRHAIQHPADSRVPQQDRDFHLFHVFDDGRSPRAEVSVTEAPWVYNDNVNIYGKPVTISMTFTDADSGVFGGFVALNSVSYTRYEKPIMLIKEMDYKLQFYAIDNVGNRSRTRTRLYALDFTPPETVHEIIGDHAKVGDEDVLSPRSKIALKSRDMKAGVKETSYRFQGKRGVYDRTPISLAGVPDGNQRLIYSAEDRVGNQEANVTFNFYLDRVPPVVSHSLIGDQYVSGNTTFVSGRTLIGMSAEDNKAGVRRIRYTIGSGGNVTYMDPFDLPKRNGKVTFAYRASDNVSNVSGRSEQTVTVDITPPVVKPNFEGEYYFSRETHYIRRSTVLSLQASDNLSGVKSVGYNLNGIGEAFDRAAFQLFDEGAHTLVFRATDNVNNVSKEERIDLYVDEVAPEIYHHFSVNTTVADQEVYPINSKLYLAATDKQAGIRNISYSINDAPEVRFENPLTFSKPQGYIVKVRAIDNVGNVAQSQIQFDIR